MEVLIGRSGTGKTTYFKEKHPDDYVILDADNLDQLRSLILATESGFEEDEKPTLINVWFDLDCKDISDLGEYENVYVETHIEETWDGVTIVNDNRIGRHYKGVKNEKYVQHKNFRVPLEYYEEHKISSIDYPTFNHIRTNIPQVNLSSKYWIDLLGLNFGRIQGSWVEDVIWAWLHENQ